MAQDEKMLVSVPDRAAALRVGKAILEAHGAWETENVMHGGQAPWCEQHCILLGQAAMLEALSAAPAADADRVREAAIVAKNMAEILRDQLKDHSRYLNPAQARAAPPAPQDDALRIAVEALRYAHGLFDAFDCALTEDQHVVNVSRKAASRMEQALAALKSEKK